MAHDVFISHSSRDKPVSDAVCAALENAGIRCWVAPRDVQPGRSFAGEITRAIQQSKAMVLIFSANSNNSSQVLREVQLAVDSQLHILQFRIEEVLLNDDLKYFLSTPHWLDAMTPPLDRHLGRLAASLQTLLGKTISEDTVSRATPAVAEERGPAQRPMEVQPPQSTAPPVTSAPPVRRKSRVPILLAALAVIGGIMAVLLFQRSKSPSRDWKAAASESPAATVNVKLNFSDIAPGFLTADALVAKGIQSVRTKGGRLAVNDGEAGMVFLPGHNRILNVRGSDPQTELAFDFDPPIKKFGLSRIGGNPASLPTWSLEARDAQNYLLDSVADVRGAANEARIRQPAYYSVKGRGIVRVILLVDNRNGTGTWATYNSLPLMGIDFER